VFLRKSILNKFLLSTLLVMLVASAATAYLSHITNRDAVADMARQLRIERSKFIQKHLENFLAEPQRVLGDIAQEIGEFGFENHLPHYWERVFLRHSISYGSFASLYFGNPDGGVVTGGHDGTKNNPYYMETDGFVAGTLRKFAVAENGSRGKELLALPDFDARSRPWYRAAAEGDDRRWGDVYVLFTGHDMSLPAVRAVHDENGKLIGVLGADTFLASLRKFLAELHEDSAGITYVIDEKGFLIASSTDEVPFERDGAGRATGRRLAARDSQVPFIRESARAIEQTYSNLGSMVGRATVRAAVKKQTEEFEIAFYKDQSGLNWTIVTMIPDATLMERVYAGDRKLMILTVIGLVMLAGAAYFLARSVTRPIERLGIAAKAVADGDFSQQIDIRRDDEIGELADSFNRMIARLRELFKDREIASEHAETSEARMRDFASSSSDWFWEMDADLRFTFFSPQYSRNSSASGRAELGMTRWDLADPADTETDWDGHRATLAARRPFRDFEYPSISQKGRIWLSVSGVPVFDESGKFTGYRGSSSDITERKSDETRLRFHAQLVELLSEGVNVTRVADGIIVYTNSQFDKLFGYEHGEMVGKSVSLLNAVAGEKPEETMRRINGIVGATGGWHGEMRNLRKDGTTFWSEVSVARMDHPEYGPIGITVRTDITERRESEERLRQAQRMEAVGQLTGGIAHDFNNLLAILLGNAELLENAFETGTPAASSVQAIKRSVERGSALTGRLLAFSRRQVLAPVDVDVMILLRDIEEMLGRTLGEDIELEISGDPGLWPARVDVGQFENAVVNLAINARHAMPRTGVLTIAARNVPAATLGKELPGDIELEQVDYVAVSVSDTGVGMPPDVVARAFEPFFTTKEVGKGSGLGLSMVYGFVKQSGGTVTIKSEVGAGTSVTIYLPRAETRPLNPAEPKPQVAAGGSEHVLVVEDDDLVRETIVSFLTSAGYRVSEAADADIALALVEGGNLPDLLLSDVVLRGRMSGPELAEELVRDHPELRVLLVSGYTRDSFVANYDLPANVHLLKKPFSRLDLLKLVRSGLESQPSPVG
jgi:PAS domain S-box-containing protein